MPDKHGNMITRRLAATVMLATILVLPVRSLTAAGDNSLQASGEYWIKANYLHRFAMFVEWPADAFTSPEAPLMIGVVGEDPFGGALHRLVDGKRIDKRRLVVERVDSPHDARRFHILFVSAKETGSLAEFAARLYGSSTLVVGESPNVLRDGGTISFTVRDNKVGYDVDLSAAKRARLTISSKLSSLARILRR
jgi:hypothetical protein